MKEEQRSEQSCPADGPEHDSCRGGDIMVQQVTSRGAERRAGMRTVRVDVTM